MPGYFLRLPLAISWLFRPRKANAIKMQTYECGVETVGDTWVQFKVQYYIYGLVFLVFDVELIFLFPWALAYNQFELLRLRRWLAVHLPAGGRADLRLAQKRAGMGIRL